MEYANHQVYNPSSDYPPSSAPIDYSYLYPYYEAYRKDYPVNSDNISAFDRIQYTRCFENCNVESAFNSRGGAAEVVVSASDCGAFQDTSTTSESENLVQRNCGNTNYFQNFNENITQVSSTFEEDSSSCPLVNHHHHPQNPYETIDSEEEDEEDDSDFTEECLAPKQGEDVKFDTFVFIFWFRCASESVAVSIADLLIKVKVLVVLHV